MNEKALRKRIFTIAAPVIVTGLIQYLQLMLDMAMLGHSRTIYLSALANVLYPYMTMLSFLFALVSGVSIQIAHAFGAKQPRVAARYAEVSFAWISVSTLVFFVFWMVLAEAVFRALGAQGGALVGAVAYVQLLAWSLPLFGIELTIASTLQGVGITRPLMYVGILRTLLNGFLDYGLIDGRLGFPAMGIEGAALATTVSNLVAVVALGCWFAAARRKILPIRFAGVLRPKWRIFRRVVKVGVPAGLEFMLFNIGQLMIIRLLNSVDPLAPGIYSLVNRLQAFGLFIYLGFARAAMTLVGMLLGARDRVGAMLAAKLANRYSLLVAGFFSVVYLLAPGVVLSLFSDDPELLERALPLLAVVAFTALPQTVNVVIGHAIRGMKDTRWMLKTQLLGTLFVIASATVSISLAGAGMFVVYLVYLADESVRALVNYRRFVHDRRSLRKIFARRTVSSG
jgi:putative MATE family efflux protein